MKVARRPRRRADRIRDEHYRRTHPRARALTDQPIEAQFLTPGERAPALPGRRSSRRRAQRLEPAWRAVTLAPSMGSVGGRRGPRTRGNGRALFGGRSRVDPRARRWRTGGAQRFTRRALLGPGHLVVEMITTRPRALRPDRGQARRGPHRRGDHAVSAAPPQVRARAGRRGGPHRPGPALGPDRRLALALAAEARGRDPSTIEVRRRPGRPGRQDVRHLERIPLCSIRQCQRSLALGGSAGGEHRRWPGQAGRASRTCSKRSGTPPSMSVTVAWFSVEDLGGQVRWCASTRSTTPSRSLYSWPASPWSSSTTSGCSPSLRCRRRPSTASSMPPMSGIDP